jgi:hypothetical protein
MPINLCVMYYVLISLVSIIPCVQVTENILLSCPHPGTECTKSCHGRMIACPKGRKR